MEISYMEGLFGSAEKDGKSMDKKRQFITTFFVILALVGLYVSEVILNFPTLYGIIFCGVMLSISSVLLFTAKSSDSDENKE